MTVFCSIRRLNLSLVGVFVAVLQAGYIPAQESTILVQTVKAADPELAWAVPAPVPFGTALDATELNATARTPGVFQYTPAAGTIPQSGQVDLGVVFTPNNSNFMTTKTSVTLRVTPPGSSNFSLALGSGMGAGESIVLKPGQATVVALTVTPIGDFHQPVTFSCGETKPQVRCAFSPAVARPVVSPGTVMMTVAVAEIVKHAPFDGPANEPKVVLLFPFAFVGLLLLRVRIRWRACCWFGLLGLASLTGLSGCGATGAHVKPRMRELKVTAKSLVESRTVSLQYVLEGER